MSKTILFIDGENFRKKINDVLQAKGISTFDLTIVDFDKLFNEPLKEFKIARRIFYSAKLAIHPDTQKKSEKLVHFQRKLINSLRKQGYEFVMAGKVMGQKIGGKVVFKEKGVDVKMAVDLVSMSCDKELKTAILCSSDSDLQPAIKELHKRNVEVVYLGFELSPNKGMTYTTSRTILFRNSEIVNAIKPAL